jgi:CRP-like cAMP-binding protein
MTQTPARLSHDELRELFLFEHLDEEQLAWVADNGDVVEFPAGADVSVEGEPAECFFVLLDGTLSMVRTIGGSEVETVRSSDRGVYSGAVQFYFGERLEQVYPATVRAITDTRFLALPAQPFAEVFRRWYPMAVHLLEGLFIGQRNIAEVVGQRERLLAMGKLTAGLTHELNNPAAAASRATAALRDRFAGMRHKLAMLADGRLDAEVLRALTVLQEEFVSRIGSARDLSALERSDREDALGEWLEERGSLPGCSSPPGWGTTTSSGSPPPSRRPSSNRPCAGWPTPSRPRRCWWRSPTARAGSRRWSTPPSSTRRWTAPRTSRPTCTWGWTPRW